MHPMAIQAVTLIALLLALFALLPPFDKFSDEQD